MNVFLASVLAASCIAKASAHGYITIPPAKQLVNNVFSVTWQHGNSIGNGGGRPIADPGVCGDPFQQSDSNVASTPFNTNTAYVYSSNGLINISLTLTANHGGRHMFRVCPATTPSKACLGTNWLTATGNAAGPEAPVEGKRYWYIAYQGAARFASYPYEAYSSQWRLPAGVSCAGGCILQWSWSAYQNCALPCEDPSWDDAAKCGLDQRGSRTICDGSALLFTEVFNNCADIKITTGGVTPSPSPPPARSPPPSTLPSPPPAALPSPRTSPSPPPPTTSPSPTVCPIANPSAFCLAAGAGLFKDPCSCTSFFNCGSGGTGGLIACPTGLKFNAISKVCDWPQNVQC